MSRVERAVLRWLQRRCKHPGSEVAADILQRDNLPTFVQWCRTCGAVGVGHEPEPGHNVGVLMRWPEPTWNRP